MGEDGKDGDAVMDKEKDKKEESEEEEDEGEEDTSKDDAMQRAPKAPKNSASPTMSLPNVLSCPDKRRHPRH